MVGHKRVVDSSTVSPVPTAVVDEHVHEEQDGLEIEHSMPDTPVLVQQLQRVTWVPERLKRYARAVSHPPPGVEMALKLAVTVTLYALIIAWFGYALHMASAGGGSQVAPTVAVSIAAGSARELRVELQACTLAVSSSSGSSEVRVTDTTLVGLWSSGGSHVRLSDSGDCVVVTCVGPAEDTGFVVSAHLEIGTDVAFSSTAVLVKTTARSSVMLGDAPYGDQLSVHAEDAIVQLDSATAPAFTAALTAGLLDIRNSRIDTGTIQVGSAGVSMHPRPDAWTRLRFYVDADYQAAAATAMAADDGICLSDMAGPPTVQNVSGKLVATLGPAASDATLKSELEITRGVGTTAALGQVFVSRGVVQVNRTTANTLDTTSATGFAAETSFRAWAESLHALGAQKLRLRLLGPGMDDDLGSIASRAEWFFSYHGDVHIWHPASYFWVGSAGIFHPLTARTDVVLTSAMCTSKMQEMQSAVSGSCAAEGVSSTFDSDGVLGKYHSAVWHALPDALRVRNQSMSELYFVEHLVDGAEFSTHVSVGDSSKVVKFSASTAAGLDSLVLLSADRSPGPFISAAAKAFLAMAVIVMTIFTPISYTFMVRGYVVERDRIIAEKGAQMWPKLWKNELKRQGTLTPRSTQKDPAGNGSSGGGSSAGSGDASTGTSVGGDGGPSGGRTTSDEAAKAEPAADEKANGGGREGVGGPPTDAGAGRNAPPWGAEERRPAAEDAKGLARASSALEAGVAGAARATEEGISKLVRRLEGITQGELFMMNKLEVTKIVDKRADKLVRRGVHLFTVLDEAILSRVPETSKVDGLLHALMMVCIHFSVVNLLCLPLHLVTWLYIYNIADQQTNCATTELAPGACSPCGMERPIITQSLLIVVEVFMLFYCITIYLRRQIDFVFPPRDGHSMSRARRRLMQIHSSYSFTVIFWFLLTWLFVVNAVYAVAFLSYMVLGACVDPQNLMPVLLGILAVAFVASQLLGQLQDMRDLFKKDLEAMKDRAKNAFAVEVAIEQTMREMGFTSAHILLVILASCLAFAAFVAFLLLGVSLFMTASSMVPTLISSGLVCCSALATVRSGQVPRQTGFGLTDAFQKNFQEVELFGSKVRTLLSAESTEAALTAADDMEKTL